MRYFKSILLFGLIAMVFISCVPNQNDHVIAHFSQGLVQDFAQRSEVLIMACSQRAIDAYTHDGNHVLCGDSSDGFEIFATKNEKAAIVLGATKFTDWERTDPNNRTVFTRCYRWDSGTILCVSYVLKQSGGGEIYISY